MLRRRPERSPEVGDRDAATVGAALAAAACGASFLRVHDVERLALALAAYRAVLGQGGPPS